MKKVAEDAKDAVSEFNLEHNTKLLQKQKTLQSQISLLADNASEADLEKLIKENKSLFKLKGTEDEIAAQVKELAKTGKSRSGRRSKRSCRISGRICKRFAQRN